MGKPVRLKKKKKGGYASVDEGDQQKQQTKAQRKSKRIVKKSGKNAATEIDFKLRQAVEGDGSRTIIDIEADGNCLFRAISDQLYHDFGNNHVEVRHEVCDFIAGHKDDFAVFLVLDDEDAATAEEEDASDFETYVQNMRQDGDWGGHLELVAAARLYHRNITVFSANLEAYTVEHGSSSKSSGPDLLVSYHDNDHYNSVRRTTAGKPPPPIKTYIVDHPEPMAIDGSDISGNCDHRHEGAHSNNNGEEKDADMMVTEEESGTLTTSTSTESIEVTLESSSNAAPVSNDNNTQQKPFRPSKKSGPCPCGSGLKYRKCCLAKKKHAERLEKMRREDETTTGQPVDGPTEGSSAEMNGDFRVLKI